MIEENKELNIVFVDYSFSTRSLNIYFSGVDEDSELQNRIPDGTDYHEWLETIADYIKTLSKLIDNIFLKGGSPNKQPEEQMGILLKGLKRRLNARQNIVAFCGDEDNINDVLKEYCDYIKIGAYKPDLKCQYSYFMIDSITINLKSSNQKLLKKGEDY